MAIFTFAEYLFLRLLVHRIARIKFEVQLQNVNSRFAKKSELPSLGVRFHQRL